MEMQYYIIIFTGIIPFAAYTVLLCILIVKFLKDRSTHSRINSRLMLAHIISLFFICATFLSFILIAFNGKNKDIWLQTDLLVMLVYIVSLFLSCIDYFHSRFNKKVPVIFTILIIICALVVLAASVHIFIANDRPLLNFIVKLSVIATILFIISGYFYRYYKDKSKTLEDKTIYLGLMALYNFIYFFYLIKIHPSVDLIFAVYANLVLHVMEYYFLFRRKMPVRYNYGSDQNSLLSEGTDRSRAYQNLNDYEQEAVSLKNRLLLYFEQEKPYLSKNISIEEVAMKLYTNKTYLSRTINEELNKNFRELVNYFRVKEAMRIFLDNTEISISELMDKSGFNNNASFTSAFKINTGYTPGEWCKDMKTKC